MLSIAKGFVIGFATIFLLAFILLVMGRPKAIIPITARTF